MTRFVVVAALAAAAFGSLSCSVNQYCLNCETGDGGRGDGGGSGNGDGGSGSGSGSDGGPCVVTGVEVCDGKDNDCDGHVDEDIAEVGTACANQMGECAGGKVTCNGTSGLGCDRPPMPELCDLKDNNCNGQIDEGDPGGGAACGTNVGECTAGVNHCDPTTGTVKCYGAIGSVNGPGQDEQCNGKDDDCDGTIDEDIGALGSCGGGSGADPNAGECQTGTLMCSGGGETCVGATGPVFELCNHKDDDCDGTIDNGYDTKHDPQNCGDCGIVCSVAHATAGCAPTAAKPAGACNVGSCATGFHDIDHSPTNGCEYACLADGTEVCDGVDNDCDGSIDNGVTAPANLCKSAGSCTGAVAMCDGRNGWKCVYPSGVPTDPTTGAILPETTCDGLDNDCDGKIDEGQPNLKEACHDAGQGECQNAGVFVCDTSDVAGGSRDNPAVCDHSTHTAVTSADEICDGKDNDCDGKTDEGGATGSILGQEFVALPAPSAVKIMKYEASRPTATATDPGISTTTTFACSRQGVLPWTNVTYPDAVKACMNLGARLCTESEWQAACEAGPDASNPYVMPSGTNAQFVIQAESFTTNTGQGGKTWTLETFAGFTGTGDMAALTDSGTNNDQTAAITKSPRLDYKVDFGAATGTYYVWVRGYGADGNGDSVWVAMNATSVAAGSYVINANNRVNPDDGVWSWHVAPTPFTVTGQQIVSIYMREDGTKVDAISISRDGANPPSAASTSIWAYSTDKHTPNGQTCNDNAYDTDPVAAGDQDDILPTGSLPACFADGAGANDAYDMSGNAKEWTQARASKQNPLRGGASDNEVEGTSCELNFTLANDTFFFPNVGFRCCK